MLWLFGAHCRAFPLNAISWSNCNFFSGYDSFWQNAIFLKSEYNISAFPIWQLCRDVNIETTGRFGDTNREKEANVAGSREEEDGVRDTWCKRANACLRFNIRALWCIETNHAFTRQSDIKHTSGFVISTSAIAMGELRAVIHYEFIYQLLPFQDLLWQINTPNKDREHTVHR